jgi:hypothetical protein
MKTPVNLKHKLMITGFFIVAALSLYAAKKVVDNETGLEEREPGLKIIEVTASKDEAKSKKIRIGLILDTSNSMDGLIEQAKSQLWTIVNKLAEATCDTIKPDIQIALYEYGNDGLQAKEGYIRLVAPLTDDLDKISEELFKLHTNGGQEYCGQVIQTATRQLEWSGNESDLQIIFIAGNEPFDQGSVNYKEACTEAKKKNIIVNTIFCGDFAEGMNTNWKNGADLAAGNYMSIDQNSKTVFIPSPFDDKITELNTKLNSTYIEYGREGKMKKESQLMQDRNAATYSKSNEVNRAVSKSSHVYKNKSWDMVYASDEKEFDVTKVAKDQLPDTMKTMTNEQKVKYVETKKGEREKIKSEISTLNKQRETYIITEKKKTATNESTLDKSMIEAIKKQAAQKNLKF